MSFLNKLSIQSKLLLLLLLTSIISTLVTGYIGYNSGKTALTNTIFNQLISLRTAKAEEIKSYFRFTENHVLTLSESPLAIDAIKELKAAYQKLNAQALQQQQQQAIGSFYRQTFVPELAKHLTGGVPLAETYLPTTPAASYLQYHYIANSKLPLGQKDGLENPGDGSEYTQVHQRYHPLFRSLTEKFGYNDIYLIDAETGNIIYSVDKEPDLGTNLRSGAYADSNLARAFEEARKSRDPNFVTTIDFEPYRPSLNLPSAFISTTVFDGTDFIGVLVFQAPADEINRLLTANGEWQQVGLGETGAVSLIGSDYRLRSLPRPYVEDREAYLVALSRSGMAEDKIEQIRRLGTPVTVLENRTVAVEKALSGKEGAETYRNLRGVPVFGAYQPIQLGSFNWALVAVMDVAEAFRPVDQLTRRMLAAAAILIPLVTVLSIWLARLFVRPIRQLIAGTRRIEQGETDVQVKLNSQDEFGDLGRSFNQMADSLHQKELLIAETLQENDKLLLHLLPPIVAKRFKSGEQQIADTFPSVTILYAGIEGFSEMAAKMLPNQSITLLSDLISAFDEVSEPYGVEKMKTAGNAYVAVCGLSVARVDHTKRMMDYAIELLKVIRRFNQQQGANLGLDIGIHSGSVVGGIVGKTQFVYSLTGDTMKVAQAIHRSPLQNVIQVTQPVYEALHDFYRFERVDDVEIKGVGQLPVWLWVAPSEAAIEQVNGTTASLRR